MKAAPAILIVDDTPFNVELLQAVLAAEGFRTLEAGDGPTAVEICHRDPPDLVLLDVVMPGESGFETCARLKSDPATDDIPIIFLSALDDVQNKVTGLKAGGVDYISKPVDAREMLARVRVHLRMRERNRALVEEHRRRLAELHSAQQAILVGAEECAEAACGVYFRPLEDVSGDFFDVIPIAPGVFAYFVADVSGHGVSASFLTAAVKALLRQYAGPVFSPEDAMRGVDSVMRQMLGEEQYLTACYARLNRQTRQLSVISAGHPPLILVDRAGHAEILQTDSEPLGVFSSTVLQRKELQVAPGDRFFLYSDGLIESLPGGARQSGLARLVEACIDHRAAPLAEAPTRIARQLRPDAQAITDDLVLMAVEACP
ncbi:Serine phosphatase RsbU, regulator of sigma subunit [Candidatus Sulfopaludibacter sp. SbA4]|nr:Serine phosphatase RsbU, regulator of sigma subunit [Candidatus Sulfopaludibacter sp. SbA4]